LRRARRKATIRRHSPEVTTIVVFLSAAGPLQRTRQIENLRAPARACIDAGPEGIPAAAETDAASADDPSTIEPGDHTVLEPGAEEGDLSEILEVGVDDAKER
jgi:hypothetical protein